MYPRTLGVYSKAAAGKTGVGTTLSDKASSTYWYARRLSDETYEVQPLNENNVPSGMRHELSKGDFMRDFTPEPGFYEQRTLPQLKSLQKKLELGAQYLDQRLFGPAEREFLKATMIDEENVEANLGLGTVYSESGEAQKLKQVLDILLSKDETFNEEQRHMFNTFGISLRKQGLHEEAIAYYAKALDYNDGDENLHFNIARAYYARGEPEDAELTEKHLRRALSLRPDFAEAQKFLKFFKN